MRASQINGCAFCLDMHSRDARRHGETEQRLYLLNAWRESPLYSERERAALALDRVPDAGRVARRAGRGVRGADAAQFSPAEIVNLTTLIGMINLWNRLAIGFRAQPAVDEATADRTDQSRAA